MNEQNYKNTSLIIKEEENEHIDDQSQKEQDLHKEIKKFQKIGRAAMLQTQGFTN